MVEKQIYFLSRILHTTALAIFFTASTQDHVVWIFFICKGLCSLSKEKYLLVFIFFSGSQAIKVTAASDSVFTKMAYFSPATIHSDGAVTIPISC